MKGRDEWRALSSGGDVTRAKVGHDIDAGQFGQQRWVAELQCVACAIELTGLVPYGLAVHTDGPDGRWRQACGAEQLPSHIRVDLCKGVGRQGSAMKFVFSRRVECHQFGAQSGRKRNTRVLQHSDAIV